LFILKKKWKAALLSIFLLSASHPFTGIELLSILGAWVFIEKIIVKNKMIPWYFAIGTGVIIVLHLYYYLYYLNQFPEHKSVSEQFSVNWRLRFFNMIPAYVLVAPLAVFSIFKLSKPGIFFKNTHNRLLICWLIVVVLLSNHELFMKPMQPIHFTRGYDWTAMFLLGLSALQALYNYVLKIKKGIIYLSLLACLFLSDNFLWIFNYIRFTNKTTSVMYITPEQKEVLAIIKDNSDNKTLLVSGDYELSMLNTVYTKAWSWISNPYTTPFYARKKQAYDNFIHSGKMDSSWIGRKIIFVFNKKDSAENKMASAVVNNNSFLKETESYKLITTDSLIIK
jgi:hypothetical protein